jgi:hypothetical protein
LARERKYRSNAERQAAYRRRKAQEEDRDRRMEVPEILVKTLGMLGSAHAGERANAAAKATKMLRDLGFTWRDVFRVKRK